MAGKTTESYVYILRLPFEAALFDCVSAQRFSAAFQRNAAT